MSEDIAQRSLALLREERELFDKAMAFQKAAIESVMGGAPITDVGLRAAIALACYSYDMLLCGWNSIIHGFYAFALLPIRSIGQAPITGLLVTLDSDIARKWWDEELTDGEARAALQRKIEAEDIASGQEWGDRTRKSFEKLHKFAHVGRSAVSPSFVIADDRQSGAPIAGGFFLEKQCRRLGRYYADSAYNVAIYDSQAFKTVLSNNEKLKQQIDQLVALGKPLINSWEKEMGFS